MIAILLLWNQRLAARSREANWLARPATPGRPEYGSVSFSQA
jgi:hypothetical protein